MIRPTPGKIFLADERGRLETARFRRLSTFSFGAYAHPHKAAFGPLHGLNEETLAGAHSVVLTAPTAGQVLVLPITGSVLTTPAGQRPTTVAVEQVLVLPLAAGAELHFTNPYPDQLITFLHLWLAAPCPAVPRLLPFDLLAHPDQLLALTPAAPAAFRLHLGRFQGRREAELPLPPGARCFAFVLAGAFEVEGRLLHAHDGLALWDTPAVDIEALSNDALLLALELA